MIILPSLASLDQFEKILKEKKIKYKSSTDVIVCSAGKRSSLGRNKKISLTVEKTESEGIFCHVRGITEDGLNIDPIAAINMYERQLRVLRAIN